MNLPVVLFMTYILVFLPGSALRVLHKTRSESEVRDAQSRSWGSLVAWTFVGHGILLFFAWFAGIRTGYQIFTLPDAGMKSFLYATAALVACLFLSFVADRFWLTNDSKQRDADFSMEAGSPREGALKLLVGLTAGVAEEAAYRGVGFFIIWRMFNNIWIAAFICSLAFGLSHASQGWREVVVIIGIGLMLQALVVFTDTLIFAMMVHALIDFVAFYQVNREARAAERNM